jgi:hypothetical protein
MQTDAFMRALEAAWSHALPGHESVERDSVLRELHRLLDRIRPPERQPLRLIGGGGGSLPTVNRTLYPR